MEGNQSIRAFVAKLGGAISGASWVEYVDCDSVRKVAVVSVALDCVATARITFASFVASGAAFSKTFEHAVHKGMEGVVAVSLVNCGRGPVDVSFMFVWVLLVTWVFPAHVLVLWLDDDNVVPGGHVEVSLGEGVATLDVSLVREDKVDVAVDLVTVAVIGHVDLSGPFEAVVSRYKTIGNAVVFEDLVLIKPVVVAVFSRTTRVRFLFGILKGRAANQAEEPSESLVSSLCFDAVGNASGTVVAQAPLVDGVLAVKAVHEVSVFWDCHGIVLSTVEPYGSLRKQIQIGDSGCAVVYIQEVVVQVWEESGGVSGCAVVMICPESVLVILQTITAANVPPVEPRRRVHACHTSVSVSVSDL